MSPASIIIRRLPVGRPCSGRYPSNDDPKSCAQAEDHLRSRWSATIRCRLFFLFLLAGHLATSTPVAAEAPCGSKDTQDQIEDKAIERLGFMGTTIPKNEPDAVPEGVYATSYFMRRILRGEYEVDLLETYQSDQSYSVVGCKGKLQISIPSGVKGWVQIEYKVISTDDGKSLVQWNSGVIMNALEDAALQLSLQSEKPGAQSFSDRVRESNRNQRH